MNNRNNSRKGTLIGSIGIVMKILVALLPKLPKYKTKCIQVNLATKPVSFINKNELLPLQWNKKNVNDQDQLRLNNNSKMFNNNNNNNFITQLLVLLFLTRTQQSRSEVVVVSQFVVAHFWAKLQSQTT